MDMRVPLRFGSLAEAGPDDALLVEDAVDATMSGRATARFGVASGSHGTGCVCCPPRSPAGLALARLFQARARGEVAFFRQVLAVTSSAGAAALVQAALDSDPLVAARFRRVTAR